MAQHKLGQKERAKNLLNKLREIMKLERWVNDGEAQSFLREAEALIEPETR